MIWEFPSFLWQNLDAIGFLAAPWKNSGSSASCAEFRPIRTSTHRKVLSALVFTGPRSCTSKTSEVCPLRNCFVRLLELFQQRKQAQQNSVLNESELPLLCLKSLTLGCAMQGQPDKLKAPTNCVCFCQCLHHHCPRNLFDGQQSPLIYCCVRGRTLALLATRYLNVSVWVRLTRCGI